MTAPSLIPCRCLWCDRTWIRRVVNGRTPSYCSGACRVAQYRAHCVASARVDGVFDREQFTLLRQGAIERRIEREGELSRAGEIRAEKLQ